MNWSAEEVALVPLVVTTVTSTVPVWNPIGGVTVIWVSLWMVSELTPRPPNQTEGVPTEKPVPVITTVVPTKPPTWKPLPMLGLTPVTVGAGGAGAATLRL